MENEIFVPVKGYEGLYEISNLGRVKGLMKSNSRKSDYLKNYLGKIGYYVVCLSKDKKTKHLYIHRLLCENFIENNNNYKFVDHIDNVKTNNNLSNLRWCTKRQNESFSNRKKQHHSSKYVGVCFDKFNLKYKASVNENGKTKNLGTYKSEEQAHNRYLEYIKINNPELVNLNN